MDQTVWRKDLSPFNELKRSLFSARGREQKSLSTLAVSLPPLPSAMSGSTQISANSARQATHQWKLTICYDSKDVSSPPVLPVSRLQSANEFSAVLRGMWSFWSSILKNVWSSGCRLSDSEPPRREAPLSKMKQKTGRIGKWDGPPARSVCWTLFHFWVFPVSWPDVLTGFDRSVSSSKITHR